MSVFAPEEKSSMGMELSEAQPPPLLKKLKGQRDRKQTELNDLNAAIKKLEENSDFEDMINVLSKVTRI